MARIAATAILILTALCAATESAAADPYCQTGVVYDYAAPLKQMPPIAPLASGPNDLPFGPDGLTLGYRGPGDVLVPGIESAGWSLSSTARAPRLNWLIVARLSKVSPSGSVQRTIGSKRTRLPGLAPGAKRGFQLGLTSQPGYYRLEIVFQNGAGKRLGRFGQYLRILKANFDARLAMAAATVHRGESLAARLENYGAADLSFGLDYSIESFNGSTWTPASFGAGAVPAIGLLLGPGASASCWTVTVPADAAPGRYRFGLAVNYSLRTGRLPINESQTLTTEFQVLP